MSHEEVNRRQSAYLACAVVLLLAGCSGNPDGPSEIDPAAVVVTDLETGHPVPGAAVQIFQRVSILEVFAPGYRAPRRTRTATAVTLFPETGFGPTFLDKLLFELQGPRLTRPKGPVHLVLEGGVQRMARSAATTATLASGLTRGRIPVTFGGAPPAGASLARVRLDDHIDTGYAAYCLNQFDGNDSIVESEIVINPDYLDRAIRSWQLLGHEMGHALGLGHPDEKGVMSQDSLVLADYSQAERRATWLASFRPVGTAPPDDDSLTSQGGASGFSIIGGKQTRRMVVFD